MLIESVCLLVTIWTKLLLRKTWACEKSYSLDLTSSDTQPYIFVDAIKLVKALKNIIRNKCGCLCRLVILFGLPFLSSILNKPMFLNRVHILETQMYFMTSLWTTCNENEQVQNCKTNSYLELFYLQPLSVFSICQSYISEVSAHGDCLKMKKFFFTHLSGEALCSTSPETHIMVRFRSFISILLTPGLFTPPSVSKMDVLLCKVTSFSFHILFCSHCERPIIATLEALMIIL